MDNQDRLNEIFQLQEQLNLKIGVNTAAMTEEERIKWVLNYSRAMTQELAELTDSVPWKWWAKYQKFDKQNARVEVIDLLHFLISIAQVLEMKPEDIYDPANLPSLDDPNDVSGEAEAFLWDEMVDQARERDNLFSFFVVNEIKGGHSESLYVSPDWPSAEDFAKRYLS